MISFSGCNVYKFMTKGKLTQNASKRLPLKDRGGDWVLADVIYILSNCELIARKFAIALFPVGLRKFLV